MVSSSWPKVYSADDVVRLAVTKLVPVFVVVVSLELVTRTVPLINDTSKVDVEVTVTVCSEEVSGRVVVPLRVSDPVGLRLRVVVELGRGLVGDVVIVD